MNKSIRSVFIAFVFQTVLLSACVPAATSIPPTLTSVPPTLTSTSIPPTMTSTSIPPTTTPIPFTTLKAGNWEGEDIWGNHYPVTLTVSAEGKITNFTLVQKLGGNFTCTMTLDAIDVNADHTFSYFVTLDDGDKQGVMGAFDSAETVSGIATQHLCNEGTILISSGSYDVQWTAKWTGN
jgi:hypothetical protein